MCNCMKGKRQPSGVAIQRAAQSSNGTNWVSVRYYNPVATSPIRVFDFVDAPTKFIGLAQHGSYLNVPPYAVDIDRSDGSRFVLPENFYEPMSFAVMVEPEIAEEKPAKVTRKRIAR
jgi:hypothetical protein